jgi:hypothetical protein
MVGIRKRISKFKSGIESRYMDWCIKDGERASEEEEWIRYHKHDPEFLRSIGNTSYKPQKVNTDLFLSDIMTNKKRRF